MTDETLVFSSGSRDTPAERTIALAELRSVRPGRGPGERLGGRTTLVAELRDGTAVAIAGVGTLGTVYELTERLRAAVGETA
ncbi:MAG TPA: hypothetical protein VHD91_01045 [Gaiellaceae bacterium]|nr:hypothetical protein [Gaiellaceae bacterium]